MRDDFEEGTEDGGESWWRLALCGGGIGTGLSIHFGKVVLFISPIFQMFLETIFGYAKTIPLLLAYLKLLPYPLKADNNVLTLLCSC